MEGMRAGSAIRGGGPRGASDSEYGWEDNERKIQKLRTCKAVQLFIQLFPLLYEIHSCGATPLSRQQLIELRRNTLVECQGGGEVQGGPSILWNGSVWS